MAMGLEGPALSLATTTGVRVYDKFKNYPGDIQTSRHVLTEHLDHIQAMQDHIDQFPSEYSSSSIVNIENTLDEQRQIQENEKKRLKKDEDRGRARYTGIPGTREARARSLSEVRNGIKKMEREVTKHKTRSESRESRVKRREREANSSRSNDDAPRETVDERKNSTTKNFPPVKSRSTTENVRPSEHRTVRQDTASKSKSTTRNLGPSNRTTKQDTPSKSRLKTDNVHPLEDRTVNQDTKRRGSVKRRRSIKRRKSVDPVEDIITLPHQSPSAAIDTPTASVPVPILPQAAPQLAAVLPPPVPAPVVAVQAQAPQQAPPVRKNRDPMYYRNPKAGR